MYPDLSLYIDGRFHGLEGRKSQEVRDPATQALLGFLPWAEPQDIDAALNAAHAAFKTWRQVSPVERSDILRKAAALARERAPEIGRGITMDNGKPLTDAVGEVVNAAEHVEWHAEEGRRIYGRVVPSRQSAVRQLVVREPVGVCAAFSPWNFPFGQAMKKAAAAIAAGCTIVLKGPEESPSAIVAMARLFHDAGLPPGVFNIVWGVPADISRQLIESPLVRIVSFTGSVPVGRQLASLAGMHMKRMTMELGGHAPVLVFDDADVAQAALLLARLKTRNAGQVCVSPTRFFVQAGIYDRFTAAFADALRAIKVGSGLTEGVQMGPLIHARRFEAVNELVRDAQAAGAEVLVGGGRIGESGHFHAPTLIANVPDRARVMQEEPFGPVAALSRFHAVEEALSKANALPFGGVKDSGFGSEGGTESFDSFLVTKLITQI